MNLNKHVQKLTTDLSSYSNTPFIIKMSTTRKKTVLTMTIRI